MGIGCSTSSNRRLQSAQLPTTPYTCNQPGFCPDGTVKSSCTWNRFFIASGYNPLQGSSTDINIDGNRYSAVIVCTNSLPNHCYMGDESGFNPIENMDSTTGYVCFSAAFNVPPSALKLPSETTEHIETNI